MRQIMHDPDIKPTDRLRAAGMIWDRAHPVMTKHQIDVTHRLRSKRPTLRITAPWSAWEHRRKRFCSALVPNGLERVEALIAAENAKTKDIEGAVLDDVEYVPIDEPESEFEEEFLE